MLRGLWFIGVRDIIRSWDIQEQRLYVGKRNDLTGLINLHKHEARVGYLLVHLSLRGRLQVEEGLAEGGRLDVRGFVH